jgi:hypothetical protein
MAAKKNPTHATPRNTHKVRPRKGAETRTLRPKRPRRTK